MKRKIKTIAVICAGIFLLTGCVADLFDKKELTPPIVQISKVESNEVNESIIYFTVDLPEDGEEVEFVGISMSTKGAPKTKDRQQVFRGRTGNLALNIGNLSSDSTYYIKAFAGNESGFAESTVYAYRPAEPVPINAPCTLNSGIIIEDGASYNVIRSFASKNATTMNANYGIKVSYNSFSGQKDLNFSFQEKPIKGGRFANTSYDKFDQFSDDIYIDFYKSDGVFKRGRYVYITVDDNDKATVEFCNLEYEVQGVSYQMKGSFEVQLN